MTQRNGKVGFTRVELRKLRSLKDPAGIQRLLDAMPYHVADTAWSPRRVLREGTSHCMEAAIFAAAALRVNGHPPLIFDLEAHRDVDHVVALYRERGAWGAIAKSNYSGLRFREPVYRTLRELVMSYFNEYFNQLGARTLRGYCRPVDLSRFDHRDWMTTEQPVWFIAEHLVEVRHFPILTKVQARNLHRMDDRSFRAGMVDYTHHRKR